MYNNTQDALLFTLIMLPIIGAFFIILTPHYKKDLIKSFGLFISVVTFGFSIFLWILLDKTSTQFQFTELYSWMPLLNINFYLGVDGISLFFIILTTFLIPICLLASWEVIIKNVKEYVILFLLLESALIIVFSVLDIILFYIFFESILIPMFILIGIWGSRLRKIHATFQLFIYTLFGSVFMLLAICFIYIEVGTTDLQIVVSTDWDPIAQRFLWLAFFSSFAVKVPMVPVHIWLPEAHVEAPTAGSVILAGILLKLGGYGFLRFSIPLFPQATVYFTPIIFTIALISIVYTSATTLRQTDLKKVIAYSSVAHMGLVVLGMFAFDAQGLEGAVILMLSHGIVSSALFLCIGVLYDRHHTKVLRYYCGIMQGMPIFATIFLFFSLANLGLPGTSSFVGEFLVLTGTLYHNTFVAVIATLTVVFSAAYSMWLYNRVMCGKSLFNSIKYIYDTNRQEFFVLVPFIFLTLLMGIYPSFFGEVIRGSILELLYHF